MAAYLNPEDLIRGHAVESIAMGLHEAAAQRAFVTVVFRPDMMLEPELGEVREHPTEPGEYVVGGFAFTADEVEELIHE
jgi:hypothetical protein